jgi:hypothetical protein
MQTKATKMQSLTSPCTTGLALTVRSVRHLEVSGKACGGLRRMADNREDEGSRASEVSCNRVCFQSLTMLTARTSWRLKCTLPSAQHFKRGTYGASKV